MRRHVQFSLSEQEFNQLKAKLAERGETWQSWGEQKTAELLSESIDSFGIPLTEMAFDRSAFQNKIAEKLVGALGEFAFIQIAQKNGQKKWKISSTGTKTNNPSCQMMRRFSIKKKVLETHSRKNLQNNGHPWTGMQKD
jgi:hypothetical protein